MHFVSTRSDGQDGAPLSNALLRGLAPDGGLYMPDATPSLAVDALPQAQYAEVANAVAQQWFGEEIPEPQLTALIAEAYPFAPVFRQLSESITICELFHGPTLSFKDFAAQCLLRLLDHVLAARGERAVLLTATSGDTGSAVAAAAFGRSNIDAVVLYPKGRVSPLQEQQIATWGGNVHAIRVHGTFDDCQALVKSALTMPMPEGVHLSSANSINIGRLLPQTFYYWYAAQHCRQYDKTIVVVPSGNFGNITAGMIAARMGAPLHHFVAGTNANDTIPRYCATGTLDPHPTKATISNAMDVSVPSNFERIRYMHQDDHQAITSAMSSYAIDEDLTKQTMRAVHEKYDYLCDPHTAVAIAAWHKHQANASSAGHGLIMSTAHPAKFPDVVQGATGTTPPVPQSLQDVMDKPLRVTEMPEPSVDALQDIVRG